jgi:hypothetical protein
VTYLTLGSRTAKGAKDTTGNNPNKWTVQFPPSILAITETEFEIYKIVITGGSAAATFNVYVDSQQWDTAIYPAGNSWDPQQPLIVRYGQTIFFYLSSLASDGSQPVVTIWLRHQAELSQLYGVT